MNEPLTFGRWIKRQRAELDLTQEALADRVGCAAQTIRTIESGRRRPSREMAERLAQILEIAEDERAEFLRIARGVPDAGQPAAAVAAAPSRVVEDQTAQAPDPERLVSLPIAPNAFIGREVEQADVIRHFADPACRLLTLIGPGGIGKTRLALEVATAISADFADGVVWVALAAVPSPDRVAAAIADAMGLLQQGVATTEAQLIADLRGKQTLLVLDSIEHLLETTSLLSTILQEAPGVRMLVTSRERMRIQGEWMIELDGLALPREPNASSISHAPAVQLFLERARQMRRDFALTPDNVAAIARICKLLEGTPLGIELAAAWVRTLSCDEIATEIERSLDFLALADRDAPPRHRSLRAVFDHSWRLLADHERSVLAGLAIFLGGCRRQAAQEVANGSLPVLAALVDKSLVRRTLDATGTPRYDLHELVRLYALAKLKADPQTYEQTRSRHRAYYVRLLQQQLVAVQNPDQPASWVEIHDDLDDIRATWSWAVQDCDLATLQAMAGGMAALYEDNCWFIEGTRIFEEAAQAVATSGDHTLPATRTTLAQMRAEHGYFLGRSGHFTRSRAVLEQCLAVLGANGDGATLVATLAYLGLVCHQLGDYAEALAHLNRAHEHAQVIADHELLGFVTWLLGTVLHAQGAYGAARTILDAGHATWRTSGRPRGLGAGLYTLSLVATDEGHLDEAQALLRESLRIGSTIRDRWSVGRALDQLGYIAIAHGDAVEARYLLREAIEVFTELDESWSLTRSYTHLGLAEIDLNEPEQARQALLQALRLARSTGLVPSALDTLYGLAVLATRTEAVAEARELLAVVCAHPATSFATRQHAAALQATIADATAPTDQSAPPLNTVIDRVLLHVGVNVTTARSFMLRQP